MKLKLNGQEFLIIESNSSGFDIFLKQDLDIDHIGKAPTMESSKELCQNVVYGLAKDAAIEACRSYVKDFMDFLADAIDGGMIEPEDFMKSGNGTIPGFKDALEVFEDWKKEEDI